LKPPGKIILYVAIGCLFGLMGGMVYYASLDAPELEKGDVVLLSVEVLDVNTIENHINLETIFLVKNYGNKTMTIPMIAYELFANGVSLGTSSYSTEDIPMTGRALFLPGLEMPLESTIKIKLTEKINDVYNAIAKGENVEYSVKGMYTIETAWHLIEKEFEGSL